MFGPLITGLPQIVASRGLCPPVLSKLPQITQTSHMLYILESSPVVSSIITSHLSKEASALIHNFSLPIKDEIPVDNLEHLIFAHPTYAEGIYEAILGLNNKALHL